MTNIDNTAGLKGRASLIDHGSSKNADFAEALNSKFLHAPGPVSVQDGPDKPHKLCVGERIRLPSGAVLTVKEIETGKLIRFEDGSHGIHTVQESREFRYGVDTSSRDLSGEGIQGWVRKTPEGDFTYTDNPAAPEKAVIESAEQTAGTEITTLTPRGGEMVRLAVGVQLELSNGDILTVIEIASDHIKLRFKGHPIALHDTNTLLNYDGRAIDISKLRANLIGEIQRIEGAYYYKADPDSIFKVTLYGVSVKAGTQQPAVDPPAQNVPGKKLENAHRKELSVGDKLIFPGNVGNGKQPTLTVISFDKKNGMTVEDHNGDRHNVKFNKTIGSKAGIKIFSDLIADEQGSFDRSPDGEGFIFFNSPGARPVMLRRGSPADKVEKDTVASKRHEQKIQLQGGRYALKPEHALEFRDGSILTIRRSAKNTYVATIIEGKNENNYVLKIDSVEMDEAEEPFHKFLAQQGIRIVNWGADIDFHVEKDAAPIHLISGPGDRASVANRSDAGAGIKQNAKSINRETWERAAGGSKAISYTIEDGDGITLGEELKLIVHFDPVGGIAAVRYRNFESGDEGGLVMQGDTLYLGRSVAGQLNFPHTVDEMHGMLRVIGGKVIYTDLGSKHGSAVIGADRKLRKSDAKLTSITLSPSEATQLSGVLQKVCAGLFEFLGNPPVPLDGNEYEVVYQAREKLVKEADRIKSERQISYNTNEFNFSGGNIVGLGCYYARQFVGDALMAGMREAGYDREDLPHFANFVLEEIVLPAGLGRQINVLSDSYYGRLPDIIQITPSLRLQHNRGLFDFSYAVEIRRDTGEWERNAPESELVRLLQEAKVDSYQIENNAGNTGAYIGEHLVRQMLRRAVQSAQIPDVIWDRDTLKLVPFSEPDEPWPDGDAGLGDKDTSKGEMRIGRYARNGNEEADPSLPSISSKHIAIVNEVERNLYTPLGSTPAEHDTLITNLELAADGIAELAAIYRGQERTYFKNLLLDLDFAIDAIDSHENSILRGMSVLAELRTEWTRLLAANKIIIPWLSRRNVDKLLTNINSVIKEVKEWEESHNGDRSELKTRVTQLSDTVANYAEKQNVSEDVSYLLHEASVLIEELLQILKEYHNKPLQRENVLAPLRQASEKIKKAKAKLPRTEASLVLRPPRGEFSARRDRSGQGSGGEGDADSQQRVRQMERRKIMVPAKVVPFFDLMKADDERYEKVKEIKERTLDWDRPGRLAQAQDVDRVVQGLQDAIYIIEVCPEFAQSMSGAGQSILSSKKLFQAALREMIEGVDGKHHAGLDLETPEGISAAAGIARENTHRLKAGSDAAYDIYAKVERAVTSSKNFFRQLDPYLSMEEDVRLGVEIVVQQPQKIPITTTAKKTEATNTENSVSLAQKEKSEERIQEALKNLRKNLVREKLEKTFAEETSLPRLRAALLEIAHGLYSYIVHMRVLEQAAENEDDLDLARNYFYEAAGTVEMAVQTKETARADHLNKARQLMLLGCDAWERGQNLTPESVSVEAPVNQVSAETAAQREALAREAFERLRAHNILSPNTNLTSVLREKDAVLSLQNALKDMEAYLFVFRNLIFDATRNSWLTAAECLSSALILLQDGKTTEAAEKALQGIAAWRQAAAASDNAPAIFSTSRAFPSVHEISAQQALAELRSNPVLSRVNENLENLRANLAKAAYDLTIFIESMRSLGNPISGDLLDAQKYFAEAARLLGVALEEKGAAHATDIKEVARLAELGAAAWEREKRLLPGGGTAAGVAVPQQQSGPEQEIAGADQQEQGSGASEQQNETALQRFSFAATADGNSNLPASSSGALKGTANANQDKLAVSSREPGAGPENSSRSSGNAVAPGIDISSLSASGRDVLSAARVEAGARLEVLAVHIGFEIPPIRRRRIWQAAQTFLQHGLPPGGNQNLDEAGAAACVEQELKTLLGASGASDEDDDILENTVTIGEENLLSYSLTKKEVNQVVDAVMNRRFGYPAPEQRLTEIGGIRPESVQYMNEQVDRWQELKEGEVFRPAAEENSAGYEDATASKETRTSHPEMAVKPPPKSEGELLEEELLKETEEARLKKIEETLNKKNALLAAREAERQRQLQENVRAAVKNPPIIDGAGFAAFIGRYGLKPEISILIAGKVFTLKLIPAEKSYSLRDSAGNERVTPANANKWLGHYQLMKGLEQLGYAANYDGDVGRVVIQTAHTVADEDEDNKKTDENESESDKNLDKKTTIGAWRKGIPTLTDDSRARLKNTMLDYAARLKNFASDKDTPLDERRRAVHIHAAQTVSLSALNFTNSGELTYLPRKLPFEAELSDETIDAYVRGYITNIMNKKAKYGTIDVTTTSKILPSALNQKYSAPPQDTASFGKYQGEVEAMITDVEQNISTAAALGVPPALPADGKASLVTQQARGEFALKGGKSGAENEDSKQLNKDTSKEWREESPNLTKGNRVRLKEALLEQATRLLNYARDANSPLRDYQRITCVQVAHNTISYALAYAQSGTLTFIPKRLPFQSELTEEIAYDYAKRYIASAFDKQTTGSAGFRRIVAAALNPKYSKPPKQRASYGEYQADVEATISNAETNRSAAASLVPPGIDGVPLSEQQKFHRLFTRLTAILDHVRSPAFITDFEGQAEQLIELRRLTSENAALIERIGGQTAHASLQMAIRVRQALLRACAGDVRGIFSLDTEQGIRGVAQDARDRFSGLDATQIYEQLVKETTISTDKTDIETNLLELNTELKQLQKKYSGTSLATDLERGTQLYGQIGHTLRKLAPWQLANEVTVALEGIAGSPASGLLKMTSSALQTHEGNFALAAQQEYKNAYGVDPEADAAATKKPGGTQAKFIATQTQGSGAATAGPLIAGMNMDAPSANRLLREGDAIYPAGMKESDEVFHILGLDDDAVKVQIISKKGMETETVNIPGETTKGTFYNLYFAPNEGGIMLESSDYPALVIEASPYHSDTSVSSVQALPQRPSESSNPTAQRLKAKPITLHDIAIVNTANAQGGGIIRIADVTAPKIGDIVLVTGMNPELQLTDIQCEILEVQHELGTVIVREIGVPSPPRVFVLPFGRQVSGLQKIPSGISAAAPAGQASSPSQQPRAVAGLLGDGRSSDNSAQALTKIAAGNADNGAANAAAKLEGTPSAEGAEQKLPADFSPGKTTQLPTQINLRVGDIVIPQGRSIYPHEVIGITDDYIELVELRNYEGEAAWPNTPHRIIRVPTNGRGVGELPSAPESSGVHLDLAAKRPLRSSLDSAAGFSLMWLGQATGNEKIARSGAVVFNALNAKDLVQSSWQTARSAANAPFTTPGLAPRFAPAETARFSDIFPKAARTLNAIEPFTSKIAGVGGAIAAVTLTGEALRDAHDLTYGSAVSEFNEATAGQGSLAQASDDLYRRKNLLTHGSGAGAAGIGTLHSLGFLTRFAVPPVVTVGAFTALAVRGLAGDNVDQGQLQVQLYGAHGPNGTAAERRAIVSELLARMLSATGWRRGSQSFENIVTNMMKYFHPADYAYVTRSNIFLAELAKAQPDLAVFKLSNAEHQANLYAYIRLLDAYGIDAKIDDVKYLDAKFTPSLPADMEKWESFAPAGRPALKYTAEEFASLYMVEASARIEAAYANIDPLAFVAVQKDLSPLMQYAMQIGDKAKKKFMDSAKAFKRQKIEALKEQVRNNTLVWYQSVEQNIAALQRVHDELTGIDPKRAKPAGSYAWYQDIVGNQSKFSKEAIQQAKQIYAQNKLAYCLLEQEFLAQTKEGLNKADIIMPSGEHISLVDVVELPDFISIAAANPLPHQTVLPARDPQPYEGWQRAGSIPWMRPR